MDILHTEASCGWGGQEIRILSESAGMIARGHRVALACPPEAPIAREAPAHGLELIPLPIGRKRLPGLRALRRLLSERRFDVVNTHSSTDSWLAALACASLRDAPALVRTRHISAPIARTASNRWLYARASAFVVTTGESLREEVIRRTGSDPQRVVSIPTGIDHERFAPADRASARAALGLPADRFIVGIVATLRSWKGHRFLVDAVAPLADPELLLVIVGDGPQQEALARQVADGGLEGRVRLVGQRTDVPAWLQAFDVFALPSYANEGVPQALIQAMLCGLPSITTTAGAIGEIALDGRTALVVAQQDSAALAAAILRLRADPALRASLGAAARAHCLDGFTRESMLDRMEDVFRRAAAARAVR
ncbi:glycosyltransferase family 4 protein [Quisquiliibacterium transsilvanicum]|uniref:Glycosyltransferase involved in cell wall biosynthesis n=1 Tax=Quisquiliibacterium transsilvanicum TaxID=1549638 RepID=A0A7W8HIG5_9BURK|nr:glycosyltransferase family 4 protein [Quisquiliibacterium transsilvanicum]MBB5271986.1 glycosyltransferase involved in cell wall biosynthesis [Quisquiliibacterium transsilvanicum]